MNTRTENKISRMGYVFSKVCTILNSFFLYALLQGISNNSKLKRESNAILLLLHMFHITGLCT